ncbi:hypothetical protein [Oceaniglobus roseus]|uniref:hypothetical protein n=1 Tax=Oceaniglobus roseus TaxID=1737570 RepID=UPI000C7EEFDF|nr:hypothetical protein [Kandeliimicrobium roseum]
MRVGLLAGALLLVPAPALAHAFKSGAGAWEAFVEGTAVVLAWPPTLIAMLAMGILAGLWRPRETGPRDGMVRIWPFLILGQVAGLLLSAATLPALGWAPHLVGLLTTLAAALAPGRLPAMVKALAFATGLAVLAGALDGHPLGSLDIAVYAGILFGANLGVAIAAGLVTLALDQWEKPWIAIGFRVLASWGAAILILQSAFEARY